MVSCFLRSHTKDMDGRLCDRGADDSGALEPSTAAVADVRLDMLPTVATEGAIGLQTVSIRTTSPRPSKHDSLSQVCFIADPPSVAIVRAFRGRSQTDGKALCCRDWHYDLPSLLASENKAAVRCTSSGTYDNSFTDN